MTDDDLILDHKELDELFEFSINIPDAKDDVFESEPSGWIRNWIVCIPMTELDGETWSRVERAGWQQVGRDRGVDPNNPDSGVTVTYLYFCPDPGNHKMKSWEEYKNQSIRDSRAPSSITDDVDPKTPNAAEATRQMYGE